MGESKKEVEKMITYGLVMWPSEDRCCYLCADAAVEVDGSEAVDARISNVRRENGEAVNASVHELNEALILAMEQWREFEVD